MPAIPMWFLGRNLVAFSLTPQAVAADGTLSDVANSTQSLLGLWETIERVGSPERENISPGDSRRANHVILEENNSYRFVGIVQLAKAPGAGANQVNNPLTHLADSYDYFKLVLTRAGKTATFYGVRGEFREVINKGKCNVELTLDMIDPGGPNPAVADV